VWGDGVVGDEVPLNGLCQVDVDTSESILLSESPCSMSEDDPVSEMVSLGCECRRLLGHVREESPSSSGIEEWMTEALKDCFVNESVLASP
jgi:hypothetical protein